MKSGVRFFLIVGIASGVFASCNCDSALGDLAFVCASTDECAEGFSCVAGLCQRVDAGPITDAGRPDAGRPDAGPTPDAGQDAGPLDAGSDAGFDAGPDRCGPTAVPLTDAGTITVFCALHRTMVVDADLSDWSGIPFTPLTAANAGLIKGTAMFTNMPVTDNADLSLLFALQWDDDFLYIAGKVTDDVRGIHPAFTEYYRDDCIQPYLDGNHDRSVNPNPTDDLAVLIRADNAAQEFVRATNSNIAFGGGKQSATRNTDAGAAGWDVEIAIPWSRLGPSAVTAPGRVIGFDLIIDDDDAADSGMQDRKHYLIWAQRTDGGGACDEPYCSTVGYGDAVLSGAPP